MDDDRTLPGTPPTPGGGAPGEYGRRRRGGRPRPSGGAEYAGGGAPSGGGPRPGGGRPGGGRSDFTALAPPRAKPEYLPEPETAKPARALLEGVLERMGITDATIAYYKRPEGEYLEVIGPDLANLIGRHGHTLEALNLLFNNIVNAGVKKDRHYFTIDAEGYRARRADLLKGIALQSLERAIRESRPVSLEPMLPSERKVIHIALADNAFVTTESSGAEPERHVVVIPRER